MVTKERRSQGRPTRPTKSRRIAFRLTDELAGQLERAVALTGRTQTEIRSEAIADKASAIIREQRLLELSDRDMEALLAAMTEPALPNDAMQRSIARWRERGAPV